MGHTVEGIMPRHSGDVPEKPCIWCGSLTDLRFIPKAMPQLGPQPMHMICTIDLIRCYEAYLAGRTLRPRWQERMARLRQHPALLGAPNAR